LETSVVANFKLSTEISLYEKQYMCLFTRPMQSIVYTVVYTHLDISHAIAVVSDTG